MSFITSKLEQNIIIFQFTDTDRSVYETQTNDVYEDFYEDKNMFDFCDYSKYSEFFHPVKKKVVGKIKDEVKKKHNL